MRRIALMVLAGVLALSAVEWEIEQVTKGTKHYSYQPLLALDDQGYTHVLFTQWNDDVYLKVASNVIGSWVIKEVAPVTEGPSYCLDVDSEGNTFVAFSQWLDETNWDLFIAADTNGKFVSVNITKDEIVNVVPIVTLDHEGIPHLLYVERTTPEEVAELFYGYDDAEGFHSEQVCENLHPDYYIGFDLVFDQLYIPHAFYIGDDSHLWHTTSGEPGWIGDQLNELSSEYPSAVADASGAFHVAYDVGSNSIHYITNQSGAWQDELVSAGGGPKGWNEQPSIAIDPNGDPHVVWLRVNADYWHDFYYANKTTGVWVEEPITSTPEEDELPGYGHYFAIDAQGYGHLVYCADDEDGVTQIYYAKSKAPLAIAESPTQVIPLSLELRGSWVHFSLPEAAPVRLDLYDASGRRVCCIASGIYAAGEHSVPINSDRLPTGVYFVRAESTNLQASAKFVLTR